MSAQHAEDEADVAETIGAAGAFDILDEATLVEEAERYLRENAPHDFDVLVIGAGAAGCAAALRAAQLGVRAGLIEKDEVGGTGLNRTTFPLYCLLDAPDFERMRFMVGQARAVLTRRLERAGVRILRGQARFIGERLVEVVDGSKRETFKAVHVVIAAGNAPRIPPAHWNFTGIVQGAERYLSTENFPMFSLIVGRGLEIFELANLLHGYPTAYNQQIDVLLDMHSMDDEVDPELLSELVKAMSMRMASSVATRRWKKLTVSSGHIDTIDREEYRRWIVAFSREPEDSIADPTPTAQRYLVDVVVDTVREPATSDLGLEAIGIKTGNRRILVDEYYETNIVGVHAVGGCIRLNSNPPLAAAEGASVAERIVRGIATDVCFVPRCYRSRPVVAWVGLTEREAQKKGFGVRTGKAWFQNPGGAWSSANSGWVKMVVDGETEKLLGCHIIGDNASDLIDCAVFALRAAQNVDEFAANAFAPFSPAATLRDAALATRGGRWNEGSI